MDRSENVYPVKITVTHKCEKIGYRKIWNFVRGKPGKTLPRAPRKHATSLLICLIFGLLYFQ